MFFPANKTILIQYLCSLLWYVMTMATRHRVMECELSNSANINLCWLSNGEISAAYSRFGYHIISGSIYKRLEIREVRKEREEEMERG